MVRSILLGLTLAFSIVGCGDSSEEKKDYAAEEPAPQNPPTTDPNVPPPASGNGTAINPQTGNSNDFDLKVKPVFAKICAKCHTPDSGRKVDFLTSEKAAKGAALARIKNGTMPKGAENQTLFAPHKEEIITILSRVQSS